MQAASGSDTRTSMDDRQYLQHHALDHVNSSRNRSSGGSSKPDDEHSRTSNEPKRFGGGMANDGAPPWKALFIFTNKQHMGVLSVAIMSAIAAGGIVPLQSYLLGKIFAYFAGFGTGAIDAGQLRHHVARYNVWLALLGGGAWLANAVFFASWQIFGELQARSARDRIFGSLITRQIKWFDLRQHGAAALAVRLQSQIQYLQLANSIPLGMTVQNISTSLASVFLSFYLSWRLTLVILAGVPVFTFIVSLLSRRIQPSIALQSGKLSEAAKHASNAITQIETVKCFNAQSAEFHRYAGVLTESARFYSRQVDLNSLQFAVIRFATLSMFVQGFWFGAHLLEKGDNSSSEILSAVWAAIMATGALMQNMPALIVLDRGRAAGHELREIMEPKIDEDDYEIGAVKPNFCIGDIKMKNVTFAYPSRPDQPALQNVSLFFPAGDFVYIIGHSGSGKSTIGQLLAGFYHQSKGAITLDRWDLRSLDPQWLCSRVLLVEQHSTLFRGSILENLELGQPVDAIEPEQITEAVDFAAVNDIMDALPEGLDTEVGAKGTSLSGGQRQRVALARAWLRDPSVVILDEATSALDRNTKLRVTEAIRRWRQGRTTIVITHDIEQITPDSFVSIMQDGKVVEEGYREQLEAQPDSIFVQSFVKDQKVVADVETAGPSTPYVEHLSLPAVEEIALANSPGGSNTMMGPHRVEDSASARGPMRNSDFAMDDGAVGQAHLHGPTDTLLSNLEFEHRSSIYLPTAFTNRIGVSPMRDSTQSPAIVSGFWSVKPTYNLEGHSELSARVPLHSRHSMLESTTQITNKTSESVREPQVTSVQAYERNKSAGKTKGLRLFKTKSGMVNEDEIPLTPLSTQGKKQARGQSTDVAQFNSLKVIFGSIWPNLSWKHRWLLILAIAMTVAYAVATPLFSFVFAKLLGTFYQTDDRKGKALQFSLGVLGIAISDAITVFLSQSQLQRSGQIWVNAVRKTAYRRILDQPKAFFDVEENGAPRLVECLDHHAEEMQAILGRFVGNLFITVTMVAVSILWSFASCWKLTLVTLACGPVIYAISMGLQTVSAALDKKAVTLMEDATEIFSEVFTNFKTVKSLTLEDHFTRKHRHATARIVAAGVRKAVYCSVLYGLSQASIIFLTVLIFFYGAKLVADGDFTPDQIFQVFSLLLFGIANATMVLAYIPTLSTAREAAARLLRLANLPTECHDHECNVHVQTLGDIVFHRLSFRYPGRPEQEVLRNVNFCIPARQTTAIVGTSGSGKSTIASLLLKLYSTGPLQPVQLRRITISGRDIRRIHSSYLRELIAIVPQTPVIFPGTVADNIAYGLRPQDPRNRHSRIRAVARLAGADDFITSLPNGYGTLLGDGAGGSGLSGGQMQRLAIARALLRDPQVLILDEATSALDVESAALVRETVRKLVREPEDKALTVIIITHAREMMELADKIVVMHEGQVVEMGGYKELLAKKGNFARLLEGKGFGAQRAEKTEGDVRDV